MSDRSSGEGAGPPMFETHEVFNQSPIFGDVNLLTTDRALGEAVVREGAEWAMENLEAFGSKAGSFEALELGRLANENPPKLRAFDEKGFRRDVVDYHPAYHEVMGISFAQGLHCATWEFLGEYLGEHLGGEGAAPRPGTHVARCAGSYMAAQMESGHCCPVTMTHAAVPTLLMQPNIAETWIPKVLSRDYDRRFIPASEKTSVTIGMGMTEKQGGTDVRANTTRAEPLGASEGGAGEGGAGEGAAAEGDVGGPGAEYRIIGHKWFLSAPMCDAFVILAQAPGGLSCFLLPRFLPDGTHNAMRLLRLKDKLGNRSNASSEVELAGAHAWMVGEEGRGVATIIEMVTLTRLDCAVSSAGLMRLCLANAVHHARHRTVFQKKLIDQPLMERVLADLVLDQEAATLLAFRLARAFDRAGEEAGEQAWRRLMTPVTKYWVCKAGPGFACEAMECLGGNGYVEEGLAARAFREMPVNAIWEGSGNVMCLDVLRSLAREPEAASAVLDELEDMAAGERRLERGLDRLRGLLHRPRDLDAEARTLVEGLALLAAGCLMRAHAPSALADAFLATRIEGGFRYTYGTGMAKADTRAILARVLPD